MMCRYFPLSSFLYFAVAGLHNPGPSKHETLPAYCPFHTVGGISHTATAKKLLTSSITNLNKPMAPTCTSSQPAPFPRPLRPLPCITSRSEPHNYTSSPSALNINIQAHPGRLPFPFPLHNPQAEALHLHESNVSAANFGNNERPTPRCTDTGAVARNKWTSRTPAPRYFYDEEHTPLRAPATGGEGDKKRNIKICCFAHCLQRSTPPRYASAGWRTHEDENLAAEIAAA